MLNLEDYLILCYRISVNLSVPLQWFILSGVDELSTCLMLIYTSDTNIEPFVLKQSLFMGQFRVPCQIPSN